MQLGYSKNEANKRSTVFTVWGPIERSSVVTQFTWDCTAAAVSYGTGRPSTIFPGFHINFRVKSVSLSFQLQCFYRVKSVSLYWFTMSTWSNQSPFIALQYVQYGVKSVSLYWFTMFLRVKSVSLYRFTIFLPGQISLSLLIYNIFTESNQSPFINLKYFYRVKNVFIFLIYKVFTVDCKQPFSFFRFSKGSTRARERWDARNEGGSPRRKKRVSLFSCLSRLAPSVTRVVICVSRAFCSTDQEKRETARSLFLQGQTSFLSYFDTVFTGSKQSPFIDLQEFYRFKPVSLFWFTMFLHTQIGLSFFLLSRLLQGQISLSFSISKVFTEPNQCVHLHDVYTLFTCSYIRRNIYRLFTKKTL